MLSQFERYKLTFGPTPIEKLSRLTAHLGGDVEIFAKRDDCNSGLAFGGNKLTGQGERAWHIYAPLWHRLMEVKWKISRRR